MKTLHYTIIVAFSISLLLGFQTPEAFSDHGFCYYSERTPKVAHCDPIPEPVNKMSDQFYTDDKEINRATVTLNNPTHGQPLTVTVTLDEPANGTIEFYVQIDDCNLSNSAKPSATSRCNNSNTATLGGTSSDTETFATYGNTADRDSGTNPTFLPFTYKKITINARDTSGSASYNTKLGNVVAGESLLVMVSPIVQRTIDNPYLYEWLHPSTPSHTKHGSQHYWEAHLGREVPTVQIFSAQLNRIEGQSSSIAIGITPSSFTNLPVHYTITQIGDYLDSHSPEGDHTILASEPATFTIFTINDNIDEADGSITVTLRPSSDYNIGSRHSLTILVQDDDGGVDMIRTGVPIPDSPIPEIDPTVIDGAKIMAAQTHLGAEHVDLWNRVLAAFGEIEHSNPMTAEEALANVEKYSNVPFWNLVYEELKKLEAARDAAGSQQQQQPQNATQNTPQQNQTQPVPPQNEQFCILGTCYEKAKQQGTPQQQPQEIHVPQINHTSNIAQDIPVVVPEDVPIPTADPELIEDIKYLASQVHHGHQHVDRWNRALAALGVIQHDNPMTAAEAQANTKKYSSPLWVKIANILQEREAAIEQLKQQQQQQQQQNATQNIPQEIHVPQVNQTSAVAQDSPQVEPVEPTPTVEPVPEPTYTINATLIEAVKEQVDLWNRVLAAFGIIQHDNPMTAAEAQNNTQKDSNPLWQQIADTLKKLEAAN